MQVGLVDWDALIVNGMIAKDSKLESQRDELGYLYTSSEAYRLRDMVLNNLALVGQTKDVKFWQMPMLMSGWLAILTAICPMNSNSSVLKSVSLRMI